MDGWRIFRVEKRTRGSTMLNRRFSFVFKFKRNITYPGQFELYRTFVRVKFWKRLKLSQIAKKFPYERNFDRGISSNLALMKGILIGEFPAIWLGFNLFQNLALTNKCSVSQIALNR